MERVVLWPLMAAEWLIYRIRGWCRPYCLAPYDRILNAGGGTFPITVRCKKCGRVREV